MATMDFSLDDDNFDDAFFAEVEKLEVLANSSTAQRPHHHHQQQQHQSFTDKPSSSLTLFNSFPPQLPPSVTVDFHTRSPPRELSQRISNNSHSSSTTRSVCSPFSEEQHEIERLKSELRCVSKELLDLKQECSELKKQRDKKQQLKFVHSNKKSRTCNSHDHFRSEGSLRRESVGSIVDHETFRKDVDN